MMNPKSAEALVGAGVICVLLGFFAGDPAGGLLFLALGAVSAAIPVAFSDEGRRIAAAVTLLIVLGVGALRYLEYVDLNERRQQRASPVSPQAAPSKQSPQPAK